MFNKCQSFINELFRGNSSLKEQCSNSACNRVIQLFNSYDFASNEEKEKLEKTISDSLDNLLSCYEAISIKNFKDLCSLLVDSPECRFITVNGKMEIRKNIIRVLTQVRLSDNFIGLGNGNALNEQVMQMINAIRLSEYKGDDDIVNEFILYFVGGVVVGNNFSSGYRADAVSLTRYTLCHAPTSQTKIIIEILLEVIEKTNILSDGDLTTYLHSILFLKPSIIGNDILIKRVIKAVTINIKKIFENITSVGVAQDDLFYPKCGFVRKSIALWPTIDVSDNKNETISMLLHILADVLKEREPDLKDIVTNLVNDVTVKYADMYILAITRVCILLIEINFVSFNNLETIKENISDAPMIIKLFEEALAKSPNATEKEKQTIFENVVSLIKSAEIRSATKDIVFDNSSESKSDISDISPPPNSSTKVMSSDIADLITSYRVPGDFSKTGINPDNVVIDDGDMKVDESALHLHL